MKLNVGLPVRRAKVELTWDVLNLLNLIDSDSGVLRVRELQRPAGRPPGSSPATRSTTTCRTCSSRKRCAALQTPEEQFTRNDLLSRWQMQFGVRVKF